MGALGPVQEAHEWHNKGIVSCGNESESACNQGSRITRLLTPPVLELMPPILADDLVFFDLVNGPSLLVLLVQENGLEYVVLNGPLCILQLVLEIGAIEAHLEKLRIRWDLFDQVHTARPTSVNDHLPSEY